MGKEIEIRIQLSDPQKEIVSKWLKDNAVFVSTEHHTEWYVDNPVKPFATLGENNFKDASDYFRLRDSNGKFSMCLKKWVPNPNKPGSYTHCEEFEFEVSDGTAARSLLKEIGFTQEYVIDKQRERFIFHEFEIVIDEVKELGSFLEVELKERFDDPLAAHKKLKRFLKEMGLEKIIELNRGYLSLIWNPHMNFGEEKDLSDMVF